MPIKPLLLIIALSMLIIAEMGCRNCMCCSLAYATVTAVKGTDSVSISLNNVPKQAVQDSANYYSSLGFATSIQYWNSNMAPLGYNQQVCDKIDIKESEDAGYICESINQFGDCD